ncbi:MAG TPA: hypothetical protein VF165_09480 [Nocardioidaceae bacterium]
MDPGPADGMEQMGSDMAVRERSSVVDDKLNVPLEDPELLAEVELTTNLIIAASESDSILSQEQVDDLLGLRQPGSGPVPAQQRRPE